MHYLYIITNKVNGKQYVGVTKQPEVREHQHLDYPHLKTGSLLLRRAVLKYGRENFSFSIIATGNRNAIILLESRTIAELDTMVPNGYNLTAGGEGRPNAVVSQATRLKMGISQRARVYTNEQLQHVRTLWVGRHHSPGTKDKMSKAAKNRFSNGRPHPSQQSVTIDGIHYPSIKSAAQSLSFKPSTLSSRLRYYQKIGRWPAGWSYGETNDDGTIGSQQAIRPTCRDGRVLSLP